MIQIESDELYKESKIKLSDNPTNDLHIFFKRKHGLRKNIFLS